MAVNTCRDCRHFAPGEPVVRLQHPDPSKRVGRCDELESGTDRFEFEADYAASRACYVREDFGCVEWKGRAEPGNPPGCGFGV